MKEVDYKLGELLKHYEEELPVKLTTGEVKQYADESSKLFLLWQQKMEKEKARRKVFNDQYKKAMGVHEEMNEWVATKKQPREVEVHVHADLIEGKKRYVRKDTGEEFRTMDLTPEEENKIRQASFVAPGGNVVRLPPGE